LVGVGDGRTAERLATVLGGAGARRAWVVHGQDGLDELSTTAVSNVVEWRAGSAGDGGDGGLRSFTVDPAALGLKVALPDQLRGSDPVGNAGVVKAVLDGQEGAHRDIAVLNAAAALVVVGDAADLEEGLARARESIDSGRARTCLDLLVSLSRSEAAQASQP
jgi:anthranilate phosphoribosyltransferase